MRRLIPTLTIILAAAALARPAQAQLSYGVQGATITSVDNLTSGTKSSGSYGLGARVVLQPPIPLLSIGAVGQFVYYFPDCAAGVDCGLITYSAAAKVGLGLPLIEPYAIGGLQWRRNKAGSTTNTDTGPMIGLGVQLNFGISLFLEGSMEFQDIPTGAPSNFDSNALIIKGGFLLGG